jgi:CheY-like chemotaxis protein
MSANQNVLIVDDLPGFRNIICHMLSEIGFTSYQEAADGLEAFQKATISPPALIISDFMMSPANGIDLLKMLKADAVLHMVPFILVSAIAEQDVFEVALALGATSYIPRPIDFDNFKKTIFEALPKQ